MRDLRNEFTAARLGMRAAFVELSDLARRIGIDEDKLTELHGRFWDGNVVVKQNFRMAMLMAESTDRGDWSKVT